MTAVKADLTALDAELKDLYIGQNIEELVYPENPLFAFFPKMEEMYGRKYPVPIRYGYPQGRSATFANAQANAVPSKVESWDMTATKNYADVLIDGLAAYATMNDKGAFMAAVTLELEGGMKNLANDLEISLARRATGSRGQISSTSTVSTNQISLALKSDATNFEVGMLLGATATDGAAYRTGRELVAGVDRVQNLLTSTSAAWNTVITAIAAGDFLVVDGDLNNKLSGLADWIPTSTPSATLYYGVNRSIDNRLGGSRYNGAGDLIKDGLIKGQAIAAREGGRPDYVWLNDAGYAQLIQELGAKVEFCQMTAQGGGGSNAKVGFDGVKVYGNYGPMTVMASRSIPQNLAYVLTSKTWQLCSIGPAVSMASMDDVGRVLRSANDDAYEGRIHFYGNLVCSAPGQNAVVTLPSSVSL